MIKHYGHRDFFKDTLRLLVSSFFSQVAFVILNKTTRFRNVNEPNFDENNYILALRHSQQCGIHSVTDHTKVICMVSRSVDGDIITAAGGRVGFKMVRGSSKRGGATAAKAMIDRLKQGYSGMITIDGPKGPVNVVKNGIVEIAKKSGVPIVPMAWYTKEFHITLPTWDNLSFPPFYGTAVAMYGKPIYVPEDISSKEEMEIYRQQVQTELDRLNEDLQGNYEYYLKNSTLKPKIFKPVVGWFQTNFG